MSAKIITEEENKNYYRFTENYDWTKIADNFSGPETFFIAFEQAELKN